MVFDIPPIAFDAAGRTRALAHQEAGRRRRRSCRRGSWSESRSAGLLLSTSRQLDESVSALFLAAGKKAEIIGLSTQWTAPTPASPFRYGGAAGPVDVGPAQASEIARSVAVIASELDLVGLNSVDFLVSDEAVWLIEINPRPGATLDVFESNEDPLVARHVAACEGRLTPTSPTIAFKAAEIVYAPHDIVVREARELAGLGGRSIAARNAHRRRRSAVHGARLWRDRRFGANVRQRAGAKNHRSRSGDGPLSDVETISVNRRAAELTAALQPRRRALEPRRCRTGRSEKP